MSAPKIPLLRSLTLTLTERCNLRCSYCYVPVERGREMSAEVADAAIDLFARHADDGARLSLSFFGGEPFLATRLMRRSIERARAQLPENRKLRIVSPTNGLSLESEALSLCRDQEIELAVSLDGDARSTTRPFANGKSSSAKLLTLLPDILRLDPEANVIARMTVTPANVGELASNVRAVAKMGFRRIMYLPAFEERWDDEAIRAWAREHRRIGTWLVGAWSMGQKLPDILNWRGVEARLLQHRPRRACGAGERLAAVATDGRIFPCYRFVFEEPARVAECQLGDVRAGTWNEEALARFAGLEAERARPEDGTCATCPSRDGCTHFCPAVGWLSMRDPLGVPATVCRLMRAQVEAIRAYAAFERRTARRSLKVSWAAAAVVVAAASTSSAACGGMVTEPTPTSTDASPDVPGPGLCADAAYDVPGPGVCPVMIDSGVSDVIGPGICDYADAPGICPYAGDTGDPDTGGYGHGLC